MRLLLLSNWALLAALMLPQSAFSNIFSTDQTITLEEFTINKDQPSCILRIGERIRNLHEQEEEQYKDNNAKEGRIGPASSRRHRRTVSVNLPFQCDMCDVINVDILYDDVNMSFKKVKTLSDGDLRADSANELPSKFSRWSGTDLDSGSLLNFVQDDDGHMAASLIDIVNQNVLQFHSTHDGKYAVTITPSSDFPPEEYALVSDEVPDDNIVGDNNGERMLRTRNSNNNKKDALSSLSSSNTQWNKSAASSMLGQIKNNISKQAERKMYDDLGGNLDVMVVWTKKAECDLNGLSAGCTLTTLTERNMRGLIDLAVFETNIAYQNSNIGTELLLVHAYRHPTYVENNSLSQSLYDITDGNLSGVYSARTTYGADLVALIAYIPGSCGIGWVGPRIDIMYSVTDYNCATGQYTFAHEIGHNLGCFHDRGTENECDTTANPGYEYGWRDPSANFRTVLAYNCVAGQCDGNAGGGCSRVPYFSNPSTTYNGQAVGNADNDTARQINDVRATVAAYYPHSITVTLSPTTSPTVSTPTSTTCGNGICEPDKGEGCGSCSSDCSGAAICSYVQNFWSNGSYSSSVYGIAFDVTVGSNALYFYELVPYIVSSTTAKIYMKSGSYASDGDLLNWTKVFDGSVSAGNQASIDFSSSRFYAAAGSTVGVYMSFASGFSFLYTQTGVFSNADVSVQTGNLLTQQFTTVLPSTLAAGYDFLSIIRYDYAPASTPSPIASTPAPVPSTPAPVPSTPAPVPSTPAPVPSTPAPVPSTPAPVPSTPAPVPSTPAPVPSTPAPVPSTPAPVPTTLAPVPSTPAPVISQPTNWQCSDSPLRFRTYSFVGAVVWRGCPWVNNKPYRCLDSNHATHCPDTCNGCNTCQDSTIRFKLVKDGRLIARDCGWVGNKQTVIRCGYNNVAQTCPQTCGLC